MQPYRDRYLNPYTDFGFKKLFGTEVNKDLLISFINSLLHGREKIKELTYLNAEHLGVGEADRKAIFDVYCENENGEKFLVEMQRGEQQYFKDRSLYYATFPIREQAHRGDWNYELKCVYIIGMLPSMTIFLLVWMKGVEKAPWSHTLIVTVGTMAVLIGVFAIWLQVRFPMGIILDTLL